jgi:ATP-dependent exoDNAse (exonuclease V) beta subunit
MTTIEKNTPPTYLAELNRHPRDEFITFDEGPHVYTVHGDSTFTSVTTFNHSHFEEFNADEVIDKMISRGSLTDPKSKYFGMTKEDIKTLWKMKGNSASTAGTKLHYDIECYNNYMEVENDSIEFQYFLKFDEDFPDLKPYRTEWMVYYEELKLSGSIDMVYRKPDGTFAIYDWKRAKSMDFENKWKKMYPPISHLPDTNYWHYSLQLNIYRRILQELYGEVVSELALVVLHPNFEHYRVFKLNMMDEEVEAMFRPIEEDVK